MEERLTKIGEDVAYIRGQLDTILPAQQRTLDDHEDRLREVEKWSPMRAKWVAPILAVILTALGIGSQASG